MNKFEWVAITYEEEFLWGKTRDEVIKMAKVHIKQNCCIPNGADDNQEDTTPITILKLDSSMRAEQAGDKTRFIFSKSTDKVSEIDFDEE